MIESEGQSKKNIEDNIAFFKDQFDTYHHNKQTLDTYLILRQYINEAIRGVDRLLDIGNGGVFDYDVASVKEIIGMDLFLDKPPASLQCPPNVILRKGSALAIPESNDQFDGVLMVMLIHHLIGKTVNECVRNIEITLEEAHRVLKPNGRLIIVESCIPSWFYQFEKWMFPISYRMIDRLFKHPAVLQYPALLLKNKLQAHFTKVEVKSIPLGRWVMIYGRKFPALLTPVSPTLFIAHK